ncbi:hypothetical protein BDV59DRAFT_210793 [Aspergillus ambiguus]|uniref:uncharacterized protein n=1 Tax=Aspergillus ambiguus TaxID=176160 RepID=UPI003CCE2C61
MAGIIDIPGSPGLGALLEQGPSPILMQRPQSSGIDLTAFSFAKPLPSGLGSRLSRESNKKDAWSANEPAEMYTLLPQEAQLGKTGSQWPDPRLKQNSNTTMKSPKQEPPRNNMSQTLSSYLQKMRTPTQGAPQELPRHKDHRTKRKLCDGDERRIDESTAEVSKTSLESEVLEMNGPREAKKRRHANGKRTSSNALIPPDNSNNQLTEEALFQILITRMKEREEKEAAAIDVRGQLEDKLSTLVEENKALQHQVSVLVTQLQKKAIETKAYRFQIDGWRTRLANFKHFLNELGSDYQALHREVERFRASKGSLVEESTGITQETTDMKREISNASNIMDGLRSGIIISQDSINSLKQALRSEEEKCASIRTQLCHEKKRSLALEAYVRETSHAQANTLKSLRADQLSMAKNLDSAFEFIDKKLDASHNDTQCALDDAFRGILNSLNQMNEEYLGSKIDMQKCKEIFQEAAAHMKQDTLGLITEFQNSSATNRSLATELKSQLQHVEIELDSESILMEQLTANQTNCHSFQDSISMFMPCIEKLDKTVKGLHDRECDLFEQMNNLHAKLAEMNTPSDIGAEVKSSIAPTERTELEDKMKQLSSDLAAMINNLNVREEEVAQLKLTLAESSKERHEAEARARFSNNKVTELQDRVKVVEVEIREELNRASVITRDQSKEKYEQQLHGLLREKAETKNAVEAITSKMQDTQKALVEREATWEEAQKDLQGLISEREIQIQALESQCREKDGKLSERDVEIKMLQDAVSSHSTGQESLRQQLSLANEKVSELDSKLSALSAETSMFKEDSQRKLVTLQSDISRREEECSNIRKELSMANLERSNLECGKSKAKSEIHSLLRRVQDSESWLKKVKESLCQSGIMSPEEPFSDVWSKLEIVLKATSKAQLTSPRHGTIPALQDAGGPLNSQAPSTSQHIIRTPGREIFQTTEAIYRSQSIQSSQGICHESVNGEIDQAPASQQSMSILPFSSIRHQLSLEPCSSPQHIHSDLTEMLLLTPEEKDASRTASTQGKGESGERPAIPSAKESFYIVPSTQMTEEPKGSVQTIQNVRQESGCIDKSDVPPCRPKAVAFETGDPNVAAARCRDQELEHREVGNKSFQKAAVVIKATRTNKRTYSKVGHSSRALAPKNTVQPNEVQPGEAVKEQIDVPSNRGKTAKVSADSSIQNSKAANSEHIGRKASPTRLASGGSKHPPGNDNKPSNPVPNRGTKATRRRSRSM